MRAHARAVALQRWPVAAALLALLGLAACNRASGGPGAEPAALSPPAADGGNAVASPPAASAPAESIYSVVPPHARL